MLAKIWKKVLLAVCIIACIFNIMSKLVNRHSLKENLESVNDGETIFSIFQKEEVVESESELIEGVMNPEPSEDVSNETTNTTIVVEKVDKTENITQDTTNVETNTEVTEENTVETTDNSEENKSDIFKFSDFTLLFK